jgi:hypothetical protein
MRELQATIERTLNDLPRLLLERQLLKKLNAVNVSISKENISALAERILTGPAMRALLPGLSGFTGT